MKNLPKIGTTYEYKVGDKFYRMVVKNTDTCGCLIYTKIYNDDYYIMEKVFSFAQFVSFLNNPWFNIREV